MRVKTKLLVVSFCMLTVPLAGCFGSDPDPAPPEPTETQPAGGNDRLLPYEVDPNSANESELDGAHTHDAWRGLDQLTLFEGTAHTEHCGSFVGNALDTVAGARHEQQVHSGCAHWRFQDDAIVPEGTERLVVEVHAEDALDEGSMQLWYGNAHRAMAPYGDPDDDGVAEWEIPMDASEWDVAHAGETTWTFELRPSGTVAVLDGEVGILLVAHKLPDWVPRLGSAHIDHWAPDADHVFPAPDTMTILDTTLELTQPSYLTQASGAEPRTLVPLDDIVPPGDTQAVGLVLRYDGGIPECPAAHECWVQPLLNPIGSRVQYPAEQVQLSPTFGVYVWHVPEPVTPDSTYMEASGYQLMLSIRGCPEAQPGSFGRLDTCQASLATDLGTELSILMEAYQVDFDANGIMTRAGI